MESSHGHRHVGIVRALYRYPVKSMAAEALERVGVGWHGLAGDRRWAFVRPRLERSNFPWHTIRQQPELWNFRPRFTDAEDVEGSGAVVAVPDGTEYDVADPALAARLGDGVRLIKQNRGAFDAFPLSLLSVQSVEQLTAFVGEPLDALRFRPNIVVDATSGAAFPEDAWVSGTLHIGALRCRIDERDARCVMVNVDPKHPANANANVLRAIATQRGARFGVWGTTVTPGEIAVGDAVVLQSGSEED